MREALAARLGAGFRDDRRVAPRCGWQGRCSGAQIGAAVRRPAAGDRPRLRPAACGAHGRRLECARMAERAPPLPDVPAQGRPRATGRGRAAAAAVTAGRGRPAVSAPVAAAPPVVAAPASPAAPPVVATPSRPPPARDPIGDLIRAGETGSAAAKDSLAKVIAAQRALTKLGYGPDQERRRDRTGHAPGDREVRARPQACGHGRTQPAHRAGISSRQPGADLMSLALAVGSA